MLLQQIIEANQSSSTWHLCSEDELIVLTHALKLGKGRRINVYTDSKYSFLVLCVLAAIWKERGIARNSPIKCVPEILRLLEAVNLPWKVAVLH